MMVFIFVLLVGFFTLPHKDEMVDM